MSKIADQLIGTTFINDITFENVSEINGVADKIVEEVASNLEEDYITEEDLDNISDEDIIERTSEIIERDENVNEFISNLGLAISNVFSSSLSTLKKSIAPKVTYLVNEIENKAKSNSESIIKPLTNNKGLESYNPNIIDFSLFDYSKNEYVKELLDSTNKSYDSIDKRLLGLLLKSIKVDIKPLKHIDLRDYTKEVITSMYSKNKDYQKAYFEVVKEVLGVANGSINKYATELSELFASHKSSFHKGDISGKEFDSLLSFTNVYKVFEHLPNLENSISKEDNTILNHNLEVLRNIYKVSLLAISKMKDVSNGVLILNNGSLNSDELNTFLSNGGKSTDIFKYLRLRYNTDKEDLMYNLSNKSPIPDHGVPTLTVLSQTDVISDKYDDIIKSSTESITKTKRSSLEYAIEVCLQKDVKDRKLDTIKDKEARDSIRSILKVNSSEEILNVESMVYDYILRNYYKDKLEVDIYKQISLETLKIFSNQKVENIDNDFTDELILSTLSELATKFISNNFIK